MVSYEIVYEAENNYQEDVLEAIYDILVMPNMNAYQQIREMDLHNSLSEEPFLFHNKFGFQVIRIRSTKTFRKFQFAAKFKISSSVRLSDDLFTKSTSLSDHRFERQFRIEHHLYLYQSDYTQISEKNHHYHLKYESDQDPVDFAHSLNQHVHDLLTYTPNSTTVHTTANEVLALGSGVCQDYVHLFLGMARYNAIPARYVSGYINQGGNLKGASKMHAWVEIYLPTKGWVGLDPTNNLFVDHNYIKVAHGADYQDCSPIRGVLKTNGANSTNHQVKVGIIDQ